jgi:hypothetical protein
VTEDITSMNHPHPEGAPVSTPVTLERYAQMRAEMETGSLRDEVLARAGVSPEIWTATQREWLEKMGTELQRSRFELTNRYTRAFLDRQDELKRAAAERERAASVPVMEPPSVAAEPSPPAPVDKASPWAADAVLGPLPPSTSAAFSAAQTDELTLAPTAPREQTLPFRAAPAGAPAPRPVRSILQPPAAPAAPSSPHHVDDADEKTQPIRPSNLGENTLPFLRAGHRRWIGGSTSFPSDRLDDDGSAETTVLTSPKTPPSAPALPFGPAASTRPGLVERPIAQQPAPRASDDEDETTRPPRGDFFGKPAVPFATGTATDLAAQPPQSANAPPQDEEQTMIVVPGMKTPIGPARSAAAAVPLSSLARGPNNLTMEQYATLRAELDVDPLREAEILARYQLTHESRAALDAHHQRSISASPAAALRFTQAYSAAKQAVLAARRREPR